MILGIYVLPRKTITHLFVDHFYYPKCHCSVFIKATVNKLNLWINESNIIQALPFGKCGALAQTKRNIQIDKKTQQIRCLRYNVQQMTIITTQ